MASLSTKTVYGAAVGCCGPPGTPQPGGQAHLPIVPKVPESTVLPGTHGKS